MTGNSSEGVDRNGGFEYREAIGTGSVGSTGAGKSGKHPRLIRTDGGIERNIYRTGKGGAGHGRTGE